MWSGFRHLMAIPTYRRETSNSLPRINNFPQKGTPGLFRGSKSIAGIEGWIAMDESPIIDVRLGIGPGHGLGNVTAHGPGDEPVFDAYSCDASGNDTSTSFCDDRTGHAPGVDRLVRRHLFRRWPRFFGPGRGFGMDQLNLQLSASRQATVRSGNCNLVRS